MALRYENHCCDCAVPGYPCLGEYCPNRRVPVYYCDNCDPRCEAPLEEVYEVEGDHLCEDCLKEKFLMK